MEFSFRNNQLARENLAVGARFWVWGSLGYHEAYLDLGAALVLTSDALNTEPGFGQTAVFLWQTCVPLRRKVLASGWCLPVRRLEKENKEANHPHIATK